MSVTIQAPSTGGPWTINGAAGEVWRVGAGGTVEVDAATARALASHGFLLVAGFAVTEDGTRTPIIDYPTTVELAVR